MAQTVGSAEVTGLGTAIGYAGAQRRAAEHATADVEAWLDSLQEQVCHVRRSRRLARP